MSGKITFYFKRLIVSMRHSSASMRNEQFARDSARPLMRRLRAMGGIQIKGKELQELPEFGL